MKSNKRKNFKAKNKLLLNETNEERVTNQIIDDISDNESESGESHENSESDESKEAEEKVFDIKLFMIVNT
jgi:hypothetical protein